jgi:hypothetical protein
MNLPAIGIDYNDFPPNLRQILDQKISELTSNGGICIAGRVLISDGAQIKSGEDVMVNFFDRVDEPLWVYQDGWFIMGRNLSSDFVGTNNKLVLRSFGYEPNDVLIKILRGEITYVECLMQNTSPKKLGSITGIVVDDQNKPVEGASVSLSFPGANHGYRGDTGYTYPHMEMTTGLDGKYSFEGLSSAEIYIVASKSGYAFHQVKFNPPAGKNGEIDLKLYQHLKIIIDYVYQPDGSCSFAGGNLQTGTIEWVNGNDGVDFSDGRVKGSDSKSPPDLNMRQDQDMLNFQIFYGNGQQNGFYEAGVVTLECFMEAAQTGYSSGKIPCLIRHTYIVRTYENNYAKFVVRSISGTESDNSHSDSSVSQK